MVESRLGSIPKATGMTGDWDMRTGLIWTVVAVFALLAALHLYWALGGVIASKAAVPEIGKAPAFNPSPAATFAVAVALLAAAATVAAAGGKFATALPYWMSMAAALVLASILLIRAVGDFRLVGFFKTNREGRFAELDTMFYSPLCVALGLAIITIVMTQERPL